MDCHDRGGLLRACNPGRAAVAAHVGQDDSDPGGLRYSGLFGIRHIGPGVHGQFPAVFLQYEKHAPSVAETGEAENHLPVQSETGDAEGGGCQT